MNASTALPSSAGFAAGPGDYRTEAPLNVVGEEVLVKVAGTDSNEQLAFFHLVVPPMTGPPLHLQTREDELFYVLEGELVFQLGERRVVAEAGTTVFVPRGSVHTYQNFGDRAARLLIAVTPAGLDRFFEEVSARTGDAPMPDLVVLEELHAEYGITTMGPPLSR